jgi:hypothetical protein
MKRSRTFSRIVSLPKSTNLVLKFVEKVTDAYIKVIKSLAVK